MNNFQVINKEIIIIMVVSKIITIKINCLALLKANLIINFIILIIILEH